VSQTFLSNLCSLLDSLALRYPHSPLLYVSIPTCYDYAEKGLDSAVMTTWAESSISHGLIVRVVLKGADVVPCLIVWK
jgi:hypothetical protein